MDKGACHNEMGLGWVVQGARFLHSKSTVVSGYGFVYIRGWLDRQ